MTKLYHDKGAWVIPGNQERGAERVDVPSAPQALADWLNYRRVPPIAVPTQPAPSPPAPAAAAPPNTPPTVGGEPPNERKQRAAELLAMGDDADAIAAWILGAAPWQIERLFGTIGARVSELVGGAR
jgi:hypothetical protein